MDVHFVCGAVGPEEECPHRWPASKRGLRRCPEHNGYNCKVSHVTLPCEVCGETFRAGPRVKIKRCASCRENKSQWIEKQNTEKPEPRTHCRICGHKLSTYNQEIGLCEIHKPVIKYNHIIDYTPKHFERDPTEYRAPVPYGGLFL